MSSAAEREPNGDAERTRPLAGLRVIDLATFLAGPHCATLMAEFGAEVIKVEMPGQGDSLRQLGTVHGDSSLWWKIEARNKLAVTCDLRKPAGQALIKRFVSSADIVVENFRPGTLEAWGLGYEDLRAVNPAIIMVRISAFGQTGPNARRPGFGRIAQAFAGLTYLCGFPDRPPVTPGTASIADYLSGVYGCVGALIALRHRDRTGEGQFIDIGLYESIFRIVEDLCPLYDQLGIVRERLGTGTQNAAPHGHFPCGDGEWIALACTNDTMFRRLARAMGRPELVDDDRFATTAARVSHREEIDSLVAGWTSRHTLAETTRLLDEHEVPNGPIYSIAGIFRDEHYRQRQAIISVDDPQLGPLRMPAVVPRLSLTPGQVEYPGKSLGADNDRVYGRLLGLSPAEIAELREQGII